MEFFAEVQLAANVRRTSPAWPIPQGVRSIHIELVSSDWNSKVGLGSIEYGLELSTDGGTTWSLLASASGQIADKGKGIYLPTLNYSRATDLVGSLRAYALPTIDIRIGINGSIG